MVRGRHLMKKVALAAMVAFSDAAAALGANPAESTQTATPIKHVIVIIGENMTFDNIFATYKPTGSGQFIGNLLSRGIVNADGTPGPAFGRAAQFQVAPQQSYYVSAPLGAKTPYSTLPPPNLGGSPQVASDTPVAGGGPPPLASLGAAAFA